MSADFAFHAVWLWASPAGLLHTANQVAEPSQQHRPSELSQLHNPAMQLADLALLQLCCPHFARAVQCTCVTKGAGGGLQPAPSVCS